MSRKLTTTNGCILGETQARGLISDPGPSLIKLLIRGASKDFLKFFQNRSEHLSQSSCLIAHTVLMTSAKSKKSHSWQVHTSIFLNIVCAGGTFKLPIITTRLLESHVHTLAMFFPLAACALHSGKWLRTATSVLKPLAGQIISTEQKLQPCIQNVSVRGPREVMERSKHTWWAFSLTSKHPCDKSSPRPGFFPSLLHLWSRFIVQFLRSRPCWQQTTCIQLSSLLEPEFYNLVSQ